MKSIFLHIHHDCAQDGRLEVALDLARAHQSHITCVQMAPFNVYGFSGAFGGIQMSQQMFDALQARDEGERVRIEQRLKSEDVPGGWKHVAGEGPYSLIRHARLADVLILSRADKPSETKPAPLPIVAEVAIHARAPVLVVPPGGNSLKANGPIVIAWNGSMEAAHSLRLVLSFLRMAAEVHIVTIADDNLDFPSTEASRYLARHHIASELHERHRKGHSVAHALAEAARELGATALVMGAYGHSRFREAVVGGVTRDLLAQASLPLLLAH